MFWVKAINFNTWSTAAAIHVQSVMISELYSIFESNISRVICMHLICYDSSDKNCFTKQDIFLLADHFPFSCELYFRKSSVTKRDVKSLVTLRGQTVTYTRTLKFKGQETLAFFAAVNHPSVSLRIQKLTSTSSKWHGLWFLNAVIVFRSTLCVSEFQG